MGVVTEKAIFDNAAGNAAPERICCRSSYRWTPRWRMSRRSSEARPLPETSRPGGVIRRVDELGRIVIPVEIRKRFGIIDHDALEISVQGDAIVLERPRTECVFCGSQELLTEFRDRPVCADCIDELRGDDVVSASG